MGPPVLSYYRKARPMLASKAWAAWLLSLVLLLLNPESAGGREIELTEKGHLLAAKRKPGFRGRALEPSPTAHRPGVRRCGRRGGGGWRLPRDPADSFRALGQSKTYVGG